MLSDGNFHSVAIPQFGPGIENGDDLGAFDKLTDQHFYSFRTPSLRNLSLTSPYMHNGAFRNLKEVIHFYNDIFTGLTNYVPPRHPAAHLNFQENKSTYVDRLAILNAPVREPLGLTDDQVNKMETFLRRSLTSSSQRDISSK
jgi:cytochrome c peroxidase